MDTVPVSAGTEDLFDEHAGDDDDDEEDHQTFFRSNAIPQISRKPDEPVPASSNSGVEKKKKKGSYLPAAKYAGRGAVKSDTCHY